MSVRRSVAWAFSGQVLTFAVQFAGSIVITRLLSPYELGVFAISMAALGIVQVFATFSISSYLIREPTTDANVQAAAFSVNAILAVGLTIILIGFSFVAEPVLGEKAAGPVLRVVAIGNLFGIFSFLPMALLQRDMQFQRLAIIFTANAATQTGGTIMFAWNGASYMSPAYASIMAGFVTMTLALMLGRRYARVRLSIAGWRPITTFGLQMMTISGVGLLNGRLSDLLLGRLLGVAALGLYSRASSLSDLIFNNLYGTATRVIFAQLSRDYREGNDWRTTYLRGFAMISAFMWPFLTGLAILSRPAVFLLYGERWLSAALPLSALMIAQVIGVGFGMNWELFVLRGETGRQSRYEGLRLILGLPLFAIGCFFSILAAAIAKIGDALIGFALYHPHVQRLADLRHGEMMRIYRDSAMLTCVAVLPAAGLMIKWDWSARVPLPLVAAAIMIGVLFWTGLIVIIGHPLRDEFRFFLRKLSRRPAVN